MHKYEVALFDFDGTICDTIDSIHLAMSDLFKNLNMPQPTVEAVKLAISSGAGLETCLKILNPGIMASDRQAINNIRSLYKANYNEHCKKHNTLFKNIENTLSTLKKAQVRCIVVSNGPEIQLKEAIEKFNLGQYFDHIIGHTHELSPLKPDKELFTNRFHLCKKGISLDKIVMIGDTASDIIFAKRVGRFYMGHIWVWQY